MKELIEYIAKRLVDRPDEVEVREILGEHTIVLELSTGVGELGMIIGKQGRTIQALRTILAAAAAKENKRAVLELVE